MRGRHEGIHTANVPWEIYLACQNKEGIDTELYEALATRIDLDGLEDILEMQRVSASWEAAYKRNFDDWKRRKGIQ